MGHTAPKRNNNDSLIAIGAALLVGFLYLKHRAEKDMIKNPNRGKGDIYSGQRNSLNFADAVHASLVPKY